MPRPKYKINNETDLGYMMAENKQLQKTTDMTSADETSKITLQNKIDIQFMNDANGKQNHSMRGFDPRFTDFVDYIIRITHEIWEEKAIGKLYDYYANTINIHTSSGTIYGRNAVFDASIEAMAAYPDRRLYGDEVIWGGNDVDGFYSSHRLTHAGTNRGWSLYGPPTGKRVRYSAVADCLCLNNMVIEEWLVRDELSLVIQLGLDPVETAKKMIKKDKKNGFNVQISGDIERGIGQLPPPKMPEPESDTFDPEYFVKRMIHEIWNWRLLNKAREFYADNFNFEGPTQRKFQGINDYQTYVLSLLSPFPDLAMNVDHFCYVGDETVGYRTATRWTMRGTHTGYGVYGEPTGNSIRIMGVTHQLIKGGRVQSEWTLFDEFALLKQIYI